MDSNDACPDLNDNDIDSNYTCLDSNDTYPYPDDNDIDSDDAVFNSDDSFLNWISLDMDLYKGLVSADL